MQEQIVLAQALAGWERYRADNTRLATEAGRRASSSTIWFVVGLFLVPVLAGLVVAPVALVGMFRNDSVRRSALRQVAWAEWNIESVRVRLWALQPGPSTWPGMRS